MNATVSGNLDSPEGCLDALMQVIVCSKEIGWREKARHIIILSTDDSFHMAGDGKLAGIVKPNDCLCHLRENEYTHSLLMDYPSISQINKVAEENNMIIIFAVVEKQEKIYKELSERITGSLTGKLTDDSSNIVVLIKELYSKLVQSVKIGSNPSNIIEIKYFSKCLETEGLEYQRAECHGLRVGDEIKFRAEIKVLKCPENEDERNQKFIINPQGINEAVEVEIDIICDCPCEQPGSKDYEENSSLCHNRGTFQCGICDCKDGYIGKNCECDNSPSSGLKTDDTECRRTGNGTDTRICSGQGECRCGVCNCKTRSDPNEIISGKYCECDNYSCKKNGGKLCSGHGTCACGTCECSPGWIGESCDCLSSNDTCINPASRGNENSEICSGHGDCICGECICKEDGENRYSGKYCQECPTCRVECEELGPCVECHVFGSSLSPKADTKEKCEKCNIFIEVVDVLQRDLPNDKEQLKHGLVRNEYGETVEHCSVPDHADCTYFFDYWYNMTSQSIHVHASRAKQCPPPVDVLGIVAGVIGSIVLAGLVLLLIWKLLTDLHDRREFAKFEKERQMAKWDTWGKNWRIVFAMVGLCFLSCNHADDSAPTDSSSCASKETCSSCIQTFGCAWCSDPSWINRCIQYKSDEITGDAYGKAQCPDKYLNFPVSRQDILEDKPLRRAPKVDEKSEEEAVQIRPQKVKLQLRVHEPSSVDFHYAQAEGYPVDLYYLMDLSSSMADDKKKLSILGDKLAEEMKQLTSNFRIGFGSFVDKIEMPFVNTFPDKLERPCESCSKPYGFINNMPLSVKTEKFKEEVMNAKVSGNLDSPEGGLDALMQVIVCQKEIGWREKARHIVILSTDASFHAAGDGKLAGIVEPNDCKCHLDYDEYTHSLLMDYPSVSQINHMAKENKMVIIFTVVEKQLSTYKALAERIAGALAVKLTNDSSNIVDIIKGQYSKLVQSVKINDDASDLIEVKYFSTCLDESPEEIQRKECHGLKAGSEIKFRAEIKVLRCPEDAKQRHQKFRISPQGINEAVEVEIDIICDCPCEKPDHRDYERNSSTCSHRGILNCGVCACDERYVGKNCECDRTSSSGTTNDTAACSPPRNGTDTKVCSGLGECRCGICICKKRPNPNEVISGKYCECNNYSCRMNKGKLCSGHGTCTCGKCVCFSGWTGENCDCRSSNETCINPASRGNENNRICSGHGDCECGKCKCKDDGETRYSGTYCQECPTCTGQCAELGPCVECHVFGSSLSPMTDSKEKCEKCNITIDVVDVLQRDKPNDEHIIDVEFGDGGDENLEELKHCSLPDHADCTFFFDYWYDKSSMVLHVLASRAKQCAPPVDVLGIVAGVIGSIVLAGLVLLLIWKLLTDLHDRREFAKFEKDRQMAKWDKVKLIFSK
ncbi:hypothetical protein J437_LFUL003428 [Ladona fulva]|uniref:Integrin beta n=1 Tax=Ladona fulva TaxID=123851 RepID=A0A8K0K2Q0_LADFU|nr:hypothetical protein J437_LFUL003428 [Ladona fulva]